VIAESDGRRRTDGIARGHVRTLYICIHLL